MFKNEDSSLEILNNLHRNLQADYLEDKYSFSKISRAVSHLKNAAMIFKKAGLDKEALYILKIADEIEL